MKSATEFGSFCVATGKGLAMGEKTVGALVGPVVLKTRSPTSSDHCVLPHSTGWRRGLDSVLSALTPASHPGQYTLQIPVTLSGPVRLCFVQMQRETPWVTVGRQEG